MACMYYGMRILCMWPRTSTVTLDNNLFQPIQTIKWAFYLIIPSFCFLTMLFLLFWLPVAYRIASECVSGVRKERWGLDSVLPSIVSPHAPSHLEFSFPQLTLSFVRATPREIPVCFYYSHIFFFFSASAKLGPAACHSVILAHEDLTAQLQPQQP